MLSDWPLVINKKKFTGLEGGKRDLNECSYTGHYSNTLVAIPFLHRDRELWDQGLYSQGKKRGEKVGLVLPCCIQLTWLFLNHSIKSPEHLSSLH